MPVVDSDVTSHSEGSHQSLSSDAVSYENVTRNTIETTIDDTMDAKERIQLKRNLKVIHFGLTSNAETPLSDSDITKFNKKSLKVESGSLIAETTWTDACDTLQCQYLACGGVLFDEYRNHNIHMWTSLNNEKNAPWKSSEYWNAYYGELWQNKNKFSKFNKLDIKNLHYNKTTQFINNVNHEAIWYRIAQWILTLKLDANLLNIKHGKQELANTLVSPSFNVFNYEFARALQSKQLGSQIKDQNEQWHVRSMELPKDVHDHMQRAYVNKNGLMYQLVYQGWNNETNNINPIFEPGITENIDVLVYVGWITKNPQLQQCILVNQALMAIKFLTFYRLITQLLNGYCQWNQSCFHNGLQNLAWTVENILFCMYLLPSLKSFDMIPQKTSSNTNNKSNNNSNDITTPLKKAKGLKRLSIKIAQCKGIWMHNLAYKKISSDRIWESMWHVAEESNWLTIPFSASWFTFAKHSLRGINGKMGHVLDHTQRPNSATKKQRQYDAINFNVSNCKKDINNYHCWTDVDMQDMRMSIQNILTRVDCQWQTVGKFDTGVDAKYFDVNYFKKEKTNPQYRWNHLSKKNRKCHWKYNNYYYGDDWRYRCKKQYDILNSISFKIAMEYLSAKGYNVPDSGKEIFGFQLNDDGLTTDDDDDNSGTNQNNTKSINQIQKNTTKIKQEQGTIVDLASSDSDDDDNNNNMLFTEDESESDDIQIVSEIQSPERTRINNMFKHKPGTMNTNTATNNRHIPSIQSKMSPTLNNMLIAPRENVYRVMNPNDGKPLTRNKRNSCQGSRKLKDKKKRKKALQKQMEIRTTIDSDNEDNTYVNIDKINKNAKQSHKLKGKQGYKRGHHNVEKENSKKRRKIVNNQKSNK